MDSFFTRQSAADDAISWFEINATDGTLNYLGMLRDGVDGVDGLNEARTVSLSADGAHVYATAISDDAVSWFERNASTGSLTYGGRIRNGVDGVTGLNGPIDVKISPDGNHAYVTATNDSTVGIYERNQTDGSLNLQEIVQDGVSGNEDLAGASRLGISPNGQFFISFRIR